MSFKDLMTYKRILIRHIYTSVISWWDETNHAAVSLTPIEDDSSQWVSTLAPLTLLKAASMHAAWLNEHRMLYTVSDATKAAMVDPTSVNFGLQMGGGNVYNMEGLMGVDTSD